MGGKCHIFAIQCISYLYRMRKVFFLILFIASAHYCNSQITFEKNYKSKEVFTSYNINQSPEIINTNDTGYYLFTWNGEDTDFLLKHWIGLTRLNKRGEVLWNKSSDSYTENIDNGSGSGWEGGVLQYPDTGFVMVWNDTYSNKRTGLIHIDKNGNPIWGKKYSYPTGWILPYMNNVTLTLDKGIITWGWVYGNSGTNTWVVLMKTDSSGNIQWCKRYFPDNSINGAGEYSRVTLTADSGFLVVFGTVDSVTSLGGGCLMKTDKNGNPLWVKEYYPNGPEFTKAEIVNGGIYIPECNESRNKIMILKTDLLGMPLLANTYTNSNSYSFYKELTLNDGSILLTMRNLDSTSSILKIDSSGNIIWSNSYSIRDTLILTNLDMTLDNGILGYGFNTKGDLKTPFNWQLIKTDASGRDGCESPVIFTKTPTTITYKNSFCYVQNIVLTVKDTLLNFHYARIDTSTVCYGKPLAINGIKSTKDAVKVYPNPNTGSFILSLNNIVVNCNVEIYNVFGQKVFTAIRQSTDDNQIDLSSQPNGMYLYRVIANNGELVGSGKFVISK